MRSDAIDVHLHEDRSATTCQPASSRIPGRSIHAVSFDNPTPARSHLRPVPGNDDQDRLRSQDVFSGVSYTRAGEAEGNTTLIVGIRSTASRKG